MVKNGRASGAGHSGLRRPMPDPGPTPERPLVGRDDERTALVELLDEHRLITLVGPGGVGKTSLAVDVARACADRFDGGVHVTELSGAGVDDDVAGLVARQLDASTIGGFRLRSMGSATLVVLDNCESAPAASRAIAEELIDGRTDITVIATSRSPLYVRGERLVPIRPLEIPPATDESDEGAPSAAEQLFLERATDAGAVWEHSPTNLAMVRRLVRQLDGLPLAIELAAARSRVLGPGELADLLDQQLDLLVRPGRDPGRHRSLRSAIESSYAPLDAELQHALRSLAFMSSPFDLGLAHAVIGTDGHELDTLDLLSQLLDASLIDTRESATGTTEYRLLDSIRAFGRERLEAADEAAEVGERYVDAVAQRADETVAAVLASFSAEVLATIKDSVAHLINAITWCIEHDPSPARTYRMALLFFGPTGSTPEIAELARRIRATWDESAPLQAEALAVMGSLTYRVGWYDEGAELAAAAVAHPDATDMAKFMGHRTLGYVAAVRRDNDAAIEHIDAAVPFGAAFSEAFDREIRVTRAIMNWDPANSPSWIAALTDVIHEATAAEEWVLVAWARCVMAFQHRLADDLSGAVAQAEPAIDAADRAEMAWASSTAHRNAGNHLALAHGWLAAAPHYRRALDVASGLGDTDSTGIVLVEAAGAAARAGEAELATALWRTVPTNHGVPMPPSAFEADIDALEARLGRAAGIQIEELVREARRLLDGASPTAPQGADAAPTPVDERPRDPASLIVFDGGAYELDLAMYELRHRGERVAVEPQVFDVLMYLVERRGQVVTQNELLDEVWGDRFVSLNALSSRISAARRATGDDGKTQRVIRTVHGKGFSFVADVQGD